ncbi:Altered inheritance of mitochondria protein 6 [Fusarium odoratissimum]|uniref:Altered inheritance of mitochondria protein 6 n=4 Tax=Fusarium oxysporum species complex TaxID=171631 RepID=N1RGX2_FUSC4|nr:Altered inheritance of mitochondria protein 6 [Fusarium odoratissimum]TXC10634.1 hypothetical protein FocTR4_00004771 [Fusarium oxysporum f. sp. cubense]
MVSKNGVPRLRVRTNPYIFAFGMTVAAISSIALMFAAILATTSMIWPYTPEVQAGSLHIRSDSVPDDTVPIPCHSHNDYWKAEPLTSAITTGCIGIEVDVWKVRDELMVGHAEDELSTEKTLTSMYIQPLVNLLKARNQDRDPELLPRGVYVHKPNQTVVLLVDLKSNSDKSWPLLLEMLEPLRQRGWLSHVSDGEFVSRPITVVATGETKFRLVKEANPSHDVFFDAPLKRLSRGQYDNTNSYYASTSFKKSVGKVPKKGLRPTQLELIRDQISQAHIRGLMVRYWGMPLLPQNARRQVEKVLLDEGVDVINVDDLQGAKRTFAERRHSND